MYGLVPYGAAPLGGFIPPSASTTTVSVAGTSRIAGAARGAVSITASIAATGRAGTRAVAAPGVVASIAAKALAALAGRPAPLATASVSGASRSGVRGTAAPGITASIVARAASAASVRGQISVGSALVALHGRVMSAIWGRGAVTAYEPVPPVISAAAASRLRIVIARPSTLSGSAIINPPPERLPALRAGEVDTRGVNMKAVLVDASALLNDTLATISTVTVARVDGNTLGGNDLSITPAGKGPPAIDTTGYIVSWWETAGAALAGVPVDYQITITALTTGGRTVIIDLYQLVSAKVG